MIESAAICCSAAPADRPVAATLLGAGRTPRPSRVGWSPMGLFETCIWLKGAWLEPKCLQECLGDCRNQ